MEANPGVALGGSVRSQAGQARTVGGCWLLSEPVKGSALFWWQRSLTGKASRDSSFARELLFAVLTGGLPQGQGCRFFEISSGQDEARNARERQSRRLGKSKRSGQRCMSGPHC